MHKKANDGKNKFVHAISVLSIAGYSQKSVRAKSRLKFQTRAYRKEKFLLDDWRSSILVGFGLMALVGNVDGVGDERHLKVWIGVSVLPLRDEVDGVDEANGEPEEEGSVKRKFVSLNVVEKE